MLPQDALETYYARFFLRCRDLPDYAFATFHHLIGSLPRVRRLRIYTNPSHTTFEDGRVHVLCIAPSGAGKGAGYDFTLDTARAINLSTKSVVGAITENAWLGTYDIIKEWNPSEKTHTTRVLPNHGFLSPSCTKEGAPYAIVGAEEAAVVFRNRQGLFKSNLHEILTTTMNPLGHPSNLLSKDTALASPDLELITFHPEVSLLLCTVPPENLAQVVASQGFVQRFLLVYDTRTREERQATILSLNTTHLDTDHLHPAYPKDDDLYKLLLDADAFAATLVPAGGDHAEIALSNPAYDALGAACASMMHTIDPIHPFHQELLDTFIPRQRVHLIKIAAHAALLSHSPVITPAHIHYAASNHQPVFEKIMSFVESNVERPASSSRAQEIHATAIRIFHSLRPKDGLALVPSAAFVKALCTELQCSVPTAYNWIQRLLKSDKLKSVHYANDQTRYLTLPGVDTRDDLLPSPTAPTASRPT